jgi:phosphoribosylformimino-5-aminoimidazole carboxamide ribotide isomerase
MFKIIPSISVSEGKVISLKKGEFRYMEKYDINPLDLAKMFEGAGIDVLHFADLDGTRRECPVNYGLLELLAGHTNLKIDFMGGIRTDGDINKVLEYGATYFTASSVSVDNPNLVVSWIISYGRERLSLLVYYLDEKVYVNASQKKTDIDIFDHIQYYYDRGLKYLKVTDKNRNGLLEGPNFDLYARLKERFPDAVIAASGGVRSVEDIQQLKDIGVDGVIIGRALYEGVIKLNELKPFIE